MTVETAVKYDDDVYKSSGAQHCSTSTELLVSSPKAQHRHQHCVPIKHDPCHQTVIPMSSKLWLIPCKTRLCTLSILAFCLFFFFTLYTGFTPPTNPCPVLDQQPSSVHPLIRDRLRFPRTRRRLPQCIIIGCKKGGTRALLEYLKIHPKIQVAQYEVHFFDLDYKYEYGLDWYRRHMPFSFPDQITIEKSPAYFVTESVPERIKAMNESIKLLLIVRDPVTRVISDYAQLYANKVKKSKDTDSFEDLVLTPEGEVNTDYKAIQISMYDIHLSNWLQYFSLNQIHIVDGGNLINEPVSEVRKVENFLGIQHHVTSEFVYFNRTKGFYCLRDKGIERCLSDAKGRKHPDVDPKVVSKLRAFYRPHSRRFYKIAGKNFNWPEQ